MLKRFVNKTMSQTKQKNKRKYSKNSEIAEFKESK
jgi:hypothetical protein